MVEKRGPVLEYLDEVLEDGETVLEHAGVRRRFGLLEDLMRLVGVFLGGSSGRTGYAHSRVQDYLALTDTRLLLFTIDRIVRPHLIEVMELPLSQMQSLGVRRNPIAFWSWTLRFEMVSRSIKLIYYWPQSSRMRTLLRELSTRTGISVRGLGYG